MSSKPMVEKNDKIIGSVAGTVRPVGSRMAAGRVAEESSASAEASVRKAPGAFRTISEVADDLNVQQHVLRFWETKFSQIRPLKRGGGRRYYRPEDISLLRKIHHLLYTEGYTIKGVQKLLKEKGRAGILQQEDASTIPSVPAVSAQNGNVQQPAAKIVQSVVQGTIGGGMSSAQKSLLQTMLGELKEIRALIKPE